MLRMGSASRNAYDAIRAQGLPFPRKPQKDLPEVPHDLTELDDRSLMSLYAELVAWSDYLSVQVACAASDEKNALNTVSQIEARVMLLETVKGEKVTVARNTIKSNDELVAAKKVALELEAYRKLVESIYSSLERDAQLLSRELTRRTSAFRRDGHLPA